MTIFTFIRAARWKQCVFRVVLLILEWLLIILEIMVAWWRWNVWKYFCLVLQVNRRETRCVDVMSLRFVTARVNFSSRWIVESLSFLSVWIADEIDQFGDALKFPFSNWFGNQNGKFFSESPERRQIRFTFEQNFVRSSCRIRSGGRVIQHVHLSCCFCPERERKRLIRGQ
jgi:hypothetical protein